MRRLFQYFLVIVLLFSFGAVLAFNADTAKRHPAEIKDKRWTTTDHSKHAALNVNFKSGPQITKACVKCHNQAETQFHKTIHWQWKVPGHPELGKAGNSLNNFCISSNKFKDKSCNDCHTAWNGKTTDGAVNCLLCHSRSTMNFNEAVDNIKEFMAEGDADSIEMAVEIQAELKDAVLDIGMPTRKNCGECHFKGGGGDGVKHGDLDTSLINPSRKLDVHMSPDGGDFSCTRCHTTSEHRIAGRMYTIPAVKDKKSLVEDDQTSKITCISCHGKSPHQDKNTKLDDHIDKVACQSCHIPLLAREKPTKVWWDWSKAGKTKNGRPFRIKDELGEYSYMSHKGEFRWEKNVMPEYFWFDGSISGISAGDKIDPSVVVKISHPVGQRDDGVSKIFPFKVHRGKQPYDKVHNYLLTPLLSGKTGYWGRLKWDIPLRDGAKAMGIPYSGKFGFVNTSYVFPSTHMVAPAEDALECIECHQKQGRLRNLAGFYMPGRDSFKIIDILGWGLVFFALLGIGIHGGIRIFYKRNNKQGKED